jgi:tetratricopeptide (TPR) repeat protein
MKFSVLFFVLLFCKLIQTDPLLVAVLMVKNEASVMQTTLQPLVDAGIQDFLIYDTGSTDDTVQVTQDFFKATNITNFIIEQEAWVDFSASRNRALDLTEQYFPDATFMIMLDAEWTLHNGADLLKFCEEQKYTSANLYQIHIMCLNEQKEIYEDLSLPRLFRCPSSIKFIGKVHEIPNVQPEGVVWSNVFFEYNPTRYGKSKTKQRFARDLDILIQEAQDNPNDFRTAYFLAQTYACLGDWKKAVTWYEHSLTLPGSKETFFITLCKLGQIYQYLGDEKKMILKYFNASAIWPERAEPLIYLANHFKNKHAYEESFFFAQRAVNMPYPDKNEMSVGKSLYDFVRYEVLSEVAWHVGAYELGLKATKKALAACPDSKHLQQNLMMYECKLGK